MNLTEYLKLASNGAPIIVITPADGGPIVAHAWESSIAGRRGWEYVLADYHGKILGQAWTACASSIDERNREIASTIGKLKKRIAAASKAVA